MNSADTKKKGPYKKYNNHGDLKNEIPQRTKRHWKSKRRSERKNKAVLTLHSCNGDECANDKGRETAEVSTDEMEDGNSSNMTSEIEEIKSDEDCKMNIMMSVSEGSDSDLVHEVPHTMPPCDRDANPAPMIENMTQNYSDKTLIQTLLILATKVRFNLTYSATEGIVQLFGALNDERLSDATKYYWKKIVSDFSAHMSVHHLCPGCQAYVGEAADDSLHCDQCNKDIDVKSNMNAHNTFIYMPLKHQLKEIFETTSAHEEMSANQMEQSQKSEIKNICDGRLYKMKIFDGMISINFGVDGAPVFDSSNSSIWPILCIINELRLSTMKRNVLLCTLWFGQGKPKMSEYLKPFVTESKMLAEEGFSYEFQGSTYTRKCRILMCISDSIARPLLRNSHQFNGEYGCGLCLHAGESIAKGRGFTRVYPLDVHGKPFGEGLRNHEDTLHHASMQDKGIKGPSILSEIPSFDIIESLDADWMHCVALGVCRQFARLWLDSINHGKDFYFGHLTDLMDSMLKSITPDLDIARTPREISDRVHWKAHEWVVFLLFYSLPILRVLFPQKYVNHWALLVDGISVLLKESIMPSEIEYAYKCLIQFIDGVEKLYGKEHISFNVHLLAHLPRSVSNWGPLWTHSAFPFENANQALLDCVKSSNGVALQICDTFRTMLFVERLYERYSEALNESQVDHLNKMLGKEQRVRPSLIVDDTQLLGTAETHKKLPRNQYLALQRLNINVDENSGSQYYKRAIVRTEIFHSKSYSKVKKRASNCALLQTGEIFEIESFLVVELDKTKAYAIGRYFEKGKSSIIPGRRLGHLIVLEKREANLAAVETSFLKEKVTLIEITDSGILLACMHPNHRELLS